MIRGVVNAALDVVVMLKIRGLSGLTREIEAVIDTGFNGFLTLPPALASELRLPFATRGQAFLADGRVAFFDVYTVVVDWDGRERYIKADAMGDRPLIGMSLLYRHSLYLEVVEGGRVEILRRE